MNVGKEIAVLRHMTVAELRAKYAEVFGEETRSHHKDFLRKRIAWRLQALSEGDLSERARRRATELANDADLRIRTPRDPFKHGSAEVHSRTTTGTLNSPRATRPGVPGQDHRGQGSRRGVRVRQPALQVPLRHRAKGDGKQVERLPLLRSGRRQDHERRGG